MNRRIMKKQIPVSIYCDHCPWWELIWYPVREDMTVDYGVYVNPESTKREYEHMINYPYPHKKEECQFADVCTDNCTDCQEIVSRCRYLKYIEYGPYPLGDGCKVCGIKDYWDNDD